MSRMLVRIGVFATALLILLLLPGLVMAGSAELAFDDFPGGDWELAKSGGASYVSGGILTIDAPADFHEFILESPDDPWHRNVSNTRGWAIETRLWVDDSTEPQCDDTRGALQIWANDGVNLIIIGFSTDRICIAYPDEIQHPMDTTDGFHVYRIESKRDEVKIYVDGSLAIDHTLKFTGEGSSSLTFGDGVAGTRSLSYWDYFVYEVAGDSKDKDNANTTGKDDGPTGGSGDEQPGKGGNGQTIPDEWFWLDCDEDAPLIE